MISSLRPNLIYKDISTEIIEHDDDIDADEWVYENKTVFRGTFDPQYLKNNLKVYSLYDDNLKRIGLAEHDVDDDTVFNVLWFRDNAFSTLYQNNKWKSTEKTLWSKISHEAYSDCLEDDFNSIFDKCLYSKYRLVTPIMIIEQPKIYECTKCGKRSISPLKKCNSIQELPYFSTDVTYIFIDDSFIIYEYVNAPQSVSSEQEQQ